MEQLTRSLTRLAIDGWPDVSPGSTRPGYPVTPLTVEALASPVSLENDRGLCSGKGWAHDRSSPLCLYRS